MSASENRCEQMQDLLSEYVDGRLGVTESARVKAHIADCPDCASFLGFLQATSFVMTSRTPDVRPPVDLFDRVAQMTYARQTWQQKLAHFLNPPATRLALGTALAVGVFAVAVLPRMQAEKHLDATGVGAKESVAQVKVAPSRNSTKPLVATNSTATQSLAATPHHDAASSAIAPSASSLVADVVSPSQEVKLPSHHASDTDAVRNATANVSHPSANRKALAVVVAPAVKPTTAPPARTAPRLPAAPTRLAVVVRHGSDAHLSESLNETMEALRHEHTDRMLVMQPSREMHPDDRKMAVDSGLVTPALATHEVSSATESALKVPATLSNANAAGSIAFPRRHFTLADAGTGHSSIGSLLNNLKPSRGATSQNGVPPRNQYGSLVSLPMGNEGSPGSDSGATPKSKALIDTGQTADTE